MRLTRRRMLELAAASVPAIALSSCCWTHRVRVRCPEWAVEPDRLLAIDAHAHFFNASDLPVDGFVQWVVLRSGSPAVASITDILQNLSWDAAPDGAEERELLVKLSGELASCPAHEIPTKIRDARQEHYAMAVAQVREAAAKGGARSKESEIAAREAGGLPRTYDEFVELVEGPEGEAEPRKKTVQSALLFVVEMLQYRTTGFFDYLDSFRRGGGPRLDLSLSAIVDYDWWLEGGPSPPPTRIRHQVELARDLAILTGGRVHAWAPFCPLREVVHQADPTRAFSSFDLVRWAVEEQGAIGVKLYPPMGFAPAGNAEKKVWTEDGVTWLPSLTRSPGFGALLDKAMDRLFTWCEQNGVPVLAHTSASNGPRDSFEELALAPGWAAALDAHSRLRVQFGHLGGAGKAGPDAHRHAVAFCKLMRRTGAGETAFADASYWEGALESTDELASRLSPLFQVPAGERPILLDRLCFGTDWKMLAAERRAGQYANRMEKVIRHLAAGAQVDPEAQVRAFFGTNAATLLGIHSGEPARKRLDAFYAAHRVPRPLWARKVDSRA